jgi:hypothetical protein
MEFCGDPGAKERKLGDGGNVRFRLAAASI